MSQTLFINRGSHLALNALGTSRPSSLMELANGEPGAAKVLVALVGRSDAVDVIRQLVEKNIIGSELFRIYKWECGEDLERFVAHINPPVS